MFYTVWLGIDKIVPFSTCCFKDLLQSTYFIQQVHILLALKLLQTNYQAQGPEGHMR